MPRRLVIAALLICAGCSGTRAETQLLNGFFQAARLHDTAVLGNLATIDFNPARQGTVQEFVVTGVNRSGASEEVTLRALVRTPDGTVAEREMVATLERIDGRLMITALR